MNKNRVFILCVVVMISIIIWSIYGILNIRKNQEPYSVSVIVDDSFNDRWLVVREGLEQAAKENNVVMNYVFTNKFESVSQQIEVIEREIANGADGIIIQWISSEVSVSKLTEVMNDKSIVMLDSDIAAEGMYYVCGVDNYEFGKSSAKQILQNMAASDEFRIGVFAGKEDLVSVKEQTDGVSSVLKENGIKEKWILYNNTDEVKETLTEKLSKQQLDAILCLGSTQTEILLDCLEQNEAVDIEVYGSGYSPKNVYYLDKQVLKGLVVSEEFNLGYQSMLALVQQLKYHANDYGKTEVGFRAVNSEQLHKEDNEKLLFPIVQ